MQIRMSINSLVWVTLKLSRYLFLISKYDFRRQLRQDVVSIFQQLQKRARLLLMSMLIPVFNILPKSGSVEYTEDRNIEFVLGNHRKKPQMNSGHEQKSTKAIILLC